MLPHTQWSQSFKRSLHLLLCTVGFSDISSGPYGEIFWTSLPGHKGLILIVSNGQSWRVRLRIQMDFISVFHNINAHIIRALILSWPFLSTGERLWLLPMCVNKGTAMSLVYLLHLTWYFEGNPHLACCWLVFIGSQIFTVGGFLAWAH